MIHFRAMTQSDIPSGLQLCRYAGWNQLSKDWELFLTLSPRACTVAVDEQDKVVGTVTTIPYQNSFGWVGMVLVDPSQRRRGIGSQLLRIAMDSLYEQTAIRLDATQAGREVYQRLGFVDEFELSRMQMRVGGDQSGGQPAKPVQALDLQRIGAWDKGVFGADRSEMLKWLFERTPHLAFLVEQDGQLRGYCFGRDGFNHTHIGPVVSGDVQGAQALLLAVLRKCVHQSVILDVPTIDKGWREWLVSIGFSEQRKFMRMVRGQAQIPAVSETQFAILGPEFG